LSNHTTISFRDRSSRHHAFGHVQPLVADAIDFMHGYDAVVVIDGYGSAVL